MSTTAISTRNEPIVIMDNTSLFTQALGRYLVGVTYTLFYDGAWLLDYSLMAPEVSLFLN
jgi:hypothetical protein